MGNFDFLISDTVYGDYLMAIFIVLSVVIWYSTSTLGIFASLVSVITMRTGICDTLYISIIPTL